MIRPATMDDLDAIAAIYDAIHTHTERGQLATGWQRSIYPTRATAQAAIACGELFVMIENDRPVAAAKLNQEQMPAYASAAWQYPAPPDQVMVLHTLVVDPIHAGKGYGRRFVAFYEDYALRHGCPYLRMDTNAVNLRARALYQALGYHEADIVPCEFNGIPNVALVCLEKKLAEDARGKL